LPLDHHANTLFENLKVSLLRSGKHTISIDPLEAPLMRKLDDVAGNRVYPRQ